MGFPILVRWHLYTESGPWSLYWDSPPGSLDKHKATQYRIILSYIRDKDPLSAWWPHQQNIMMTSSNGNIFRITGPLCGEFTGPGEFPTQRPVTWSFDVFFHRLNKRLSKQPWGWWFETPSWSLWRQCNDTNMKGHLLRRMPSMILQQ